MADYTNSRKSTRSAYPDKAIDAQDFDRIEPIITAEKLRERFLFGIRLQSDIIDPKTKRVQTMTDEMLQDHILRAISQVEEDTKIDVFPVQRAEAAPFDRPTFQQWGYLRLEHSPILSIEAISIKPGNDQSIYNVPLEWVSTANFNKGQINFIPIMPASNNNFQLAPAGQGGGAVFLQLLQGMSWIPVFWDIQYTTGFYDGAVPRIINELIGIYAAQEILGIMAATNTTNSRSLGLDGMSQSVSTAGPQRYDTRIGQLEERRKRLIGKARALYGKKFVMTNI